MEQYGHGPMLPSQEHEVGAAPRGTETGAGSGRGRIGKYYGDPSGSVRSRSSQAAAASLDLIPNFACFSQSRISSEDPYASPIATTAVACMGPSISPMERANASAASGIVLESAHSANTLSDLAVSLNSPDIQDSSAAIDVWSHSVATSKVMYTQKRSCSSAAQLFDRLVTAARTALRQLVSVTCPAEWRASNSPITASGIRTPAAGRQPIGRTHTVHTAIWCRSAPLMPNASIPRRTTSRVEVDDHRDRTWGSRPHSGHIVAPSIVGYLHVLHLVEFNDDFPRRSRELWIAHYAQPVSSDGVLDALVAFRAFGIGALAPL